MAKQYEVVDQIADSNGVLHDQLLANFAAHTPASGKKWYVCTICSIEAREDKVVFIQGRPYCIINGCARDQQIFNSKKR